MSTCFICLKVVKKVREDYICRKCYAPPPTKEVTKPEVNWGILPDDILKIIRPFVGNFTLKPHYEKLKAIYKKANETQFDKTLCGHKDLFKTITETPKCIKITYTAGRLMGTTKMIKKTDVGKIRAFQMYIWINKYSNLHYYLNKLEKKL